MEEANTLTVAVQAVLQKKSAVNSTNGAHRLNKKGFDQANRQRAYFVIHSGDWLQNKVGCGSTCSAMQHDVIWQGHVLPNQVQFMQAHIPCGWLWNTNSFFLLITSRLPWLKMTQLPLRQLSRVATVHLWGHCAMFWHLRSFKHTTGLPVRLLLLKIEES